MGYTLDQYNALKAAIAQGARSVYYGDKRVEYRSLAEMMQIKRDMEEELGITTASGNRKYGSFSKGLRQ